MKLSKKIFRLLLAGVLTLGASFSVFAEYDITVNSKTEYNSKKTNLKSIESQIKTELSNLLKDPAATQEQKDAKGAELTAVQQAIMNLTTNYTTYKTTLKTTQEGVRTENTNNAKLAKNVANGKAEKQTALSEAELLSQITTLKAKEADKSISVQERKDLIKYEGDYSAFKKAEIDTEKQEWKDAGVVAKNQKTELSTIQSQEREAIRSDYQAQILAIENRAKLDPSDPNYLDTAGVLIAKNNAKLSYSTQMQTVKNRQLNERNIAGGKIARATSLSETEIDSNISTLQAKVADGTATLADREALSKAKAEKAAIKKADVNVQKNDIKAKRDEYKASKTSLNDSVKGQRTYTTEFQKAQRAQ